jgi:hypothetical protein
MTLARLFLADKEKGRWVPLQESPYKSKKLIQSALAKSPDLIPGDQINPGNPSRWLLVRSGTAEGGKSQQALVLVDQEAIPTFVICQDTSESEGQQTLLAAMIEQVSRGTTGWLGSTLRDLAKATTAKTGQSLTDELTRLLDGEPDEDAFWSAVDTNLRNRRLRLIFVDEKISEEFRQMLDFLDSAMSQVDVLALEMKQFQAAGHTALLPRLVGKLTDESGEMTSPTASFIQEMKANAAEEDEEEGDDVEERRQPNFHETDTKPVSPAEVLEQKVYKNGSHDSEPLPDSRFTGSKNEKWNTQTFFGDLTDHSEEEQVLVGRQLFNWASNNTSRIEWGGGATRGAFAPIYNQGPKECQLFVVTSNGWIELNLKAYRNHPPYDDEEKLKQLYTRLSAIEALDIPDEALVKRVLLPLSLFTEPSRLARFLKVFETAMDEMEARTGDLKPVGRKITRRKPNISWPRSESPSAAADPEEQQSANHNSYESSFDQFLSQKRVDLDQDEFDLGDLFA